MMDGQPTIPEPTLGPLVRDVARLLRRRFEQWAREAQIPLSRSQCAVLVRVAGDEGMSQAALAHCLDIEPIALVRIIDRLEALGLVERRFNPRDRRVWMLYLTLAAEPVIMEIHRLSEAVDEVALAGVPEQIRDTLLDTLQRLKTNLVAKPSPPREPAIGGELDRAGA
jgi:MarR family transcriptional regulator, transcriptional regulator for hemolysin